MMATATLGNRATSATEGLAAAVDHSGNIYVTGGTRATDLPVTPDAYQTTGPPPPIFPYPGAYYSFVTEYSSDLTKIIYSTYFGTPYQDCLADVCNAGAFTSGTAISVDAAGTMILAGNTDSPALGTGAPGVRAQQWPPSCFVAKLSPSGGLLAIGKLGVTVGAEIQFLAVDASGNILVSGNASDGLPFASNAIQPHAHQIYSGIGFGQIPSRLSRGIQLRSEFALGDLLRRRLRAESEYRRFS